MSRGLARPGSLTMTDTAILNFTGPHRFLSNFHPAVVELDGVAYSTVEHGYQAAKTTDWSARERIRIAPSAGVAKRLGSKVRLRRGWDEVRLAVMADLLHQKFCDPVLGSALLASGEAYLVEGNTWGDRFWGVVDGEGDNHLGLLLMQVRSDLLANRSGLA